MHSVSAVECLSLDIGLSHCPPLDHILLDTVPQQAKQYIKNIQKFDTLRLNIHIYNSNILDWFVQAPTMTQ